MSDTERKDELEQILRDDEKIRRLEAELAALRQEVIDAAVVICRMKNDYILSDDLVSSPLMLSIHRATMDDWMHGFNSGIRAALKHLHPITGELP